MEYSTPNDFALRLKVSPRTVKRWLKQGLPSVCVGRSRRILTDQADAWLLAGGAQKKKVTRTKRSAPAFSPSNPPE